MNVNILKNRAIEIVILCYALLLMLLVGPVGVLDGSRVTQGSLDHVEETLPVAGQGKIQQVFLADGGYLEKIGIYAVSDFSRKAFRMTVYDELGEVLFSRKVAAEAYEAPGFFYVPVEFDTEPGRAYVWQIGLPETELVFGRQNTADTVAGLYGNFYYVKEGGAPQEQVGENIPISLVYADPVSAAGKAAMMAGIGVVAAFLILLVENSARQQRSGQTVRMQWAVRRVCNPLIGVLTALGLWAVAVLNYYGGKREDKIVYCTGILACGALFAYAVNAKRKDAGAGCGEDGLLLSFLKRLSWERAAGFLQSVFWAGALWGCIDYVNAMYTIYQEYAFRKMLIFLGLALLTMCDRKRLLWIGNPVWLGVSAVGGFLFCRLRHGDVEAEKLDRLNVYLLVVAGLVAIQAFYLIRDRRIAWKKLCRPYAALLVVFFGFLIAFRNTRGWPLVMAGAFLLLYFFYLGWNGRGRFLKIFCDGIILNFTAALVFAVLRRPFRAWFFYRYNFVFHTVTVTSAYLALVLGALLVKLLAEYRRSEKLYDWWLTGLLFGTAASLLVMTLSRTGFLAVFVMGIVVLLFVSLACYRENVLHFLKKTGIFILTVLCLFPITYSAIHLIPPLYDDPYIFELEDKEGEWAIHKGDPADSENYITFSRFAYCLDVKLFGDEHPILRRFVDRFLAEGSKKDSAAGQEELQVSALWGLTASAAPGTGEDGAPSGVEEDYSNGRTEIFRRYIEQWNLTGHDEMGVELADGSLSVHAHNTYLQVIHDHGLLTGAVYLLTGLVSLVWMFRYAFVRLSSGKDAYAALPLAVFLSFAVAGLVEWLFHPCNPLGFSTMAVLAPLFTFQNGLPRKTRQGDRV